MLQLFRYCLPAVSTRDLDPATWLLIILYQQVSAWTVIIGTIATSGLLILYLRKGTYEIFLSKPIPRESQLLVRLLVSVGVVLLFAAMLQTGVWLVFGLKLGTWNVGFLASAGFIPLIFMTTVCVSVVASAATRNIVFSVSATYLFTFLSTFLEHRQETLFPLWKNAGFHSLLDCLYYAFPQLDRMLDNASLLIGRTPGDPTGQVFSWGPFGSSILSAIFWYLLAIWIMRRRDG